MGHLVATAGRGLDLGSFGGAAFCGCCHAWLHSAVQWASMWNDEALHVPPPAQLEMPNIAAAHSTTQLHA